MTHAESQELLLDLAYGELPAARAEEVSAHLAGCAECQREKAALDETRRMAAPLRELEEPSPGFDDRILAASRAQAQLEHDGNIGQVIEVSGSVRPMGLEPARIDAHAKPRIAEAPRRPRWAMRAALGGSVAAAAVLALVVSTSLQSKHETERASRVAAERAYEIRIQPAPVPQAANEAMREAKKDDAAKTEVAPAAASAPERKDAAAAQSQKEAPPRLAKRPAEPDALAPAAGLGGLSAASGARGGSGGDALDTTSANEAHGAAKATQPTAPSPRDSTARAEAKFAPAPAPEEAARPEPRLVVAEAAKSAAQPPTAAVAAPVEKERAHAPPARIAEAVSSARTAAEPGPVAAAPRREAISPQAEAAPSDLERQAQEARLGGDRASAAGLYRKAARLRQAAGETSSEGAWDLAHAIECLAAIGQFDEARRVRAELSQLYPSEKAAWSAAGRALREVDPPAAAKAKPASPQSPVPADQ